MLGMQTSNIVLMNDSTDEIKQPLFLVSTPDESYQVLLTVIDLGWQVEEPIYLRHRWNEDGPWVYHFILNRNPYEQSCLISVLWSPKVERFGQNEGWAVDQHPFAQPPK